MHGPHIGMETEAECRNVVGGGRAVLAGDGHSGGHGGWLDEMELPGPLLLV